MDNEIFTMLMDATKQNYQNFLHSVWTALGAIMVAIGWLLTSKVARDHIATQPALKSIIILIIGAFLVVHVSVLIWHKLKSNRLGTMLMEDCFVKSHNIETNVIDIYRIPLASVIITCVMNGSLLMVLMFLVSTL